MAEFYSMLTDFLVLLSVVVAIFYLIGLANSSKVYKVFAWYLVAMAVLQLVSYYIVSILREENLYMFHYYYLIQFFLLSLFYYHLIHSKWIIYVTATATLILGAMYVNEPTIFFEYTPLGVTLTQTILVIYAIIYFYRSLSGSLRFIFINIGLFFYLLTSILVFASGNLLLDLDIAEDQLIVLSYINEFTYLVFLALALIEWLKNHSSFLFKKRDYV